MNRRPVLLLALLAALSLVVFWPREASPDPEVDNQVTQEDSNAPGVVLPEEEDALVRTDMALVEPAEAHADLSTGVVMVRLEVEEGVAFPLEAEVYLTAYPEGRPTRRHTKKTKTGLAVFENIGFGVDFDIMVIAFRGSIKVDAEGTTQSVADGSTDLTLQLLDDSFLLHGELLTPQGKPLKASTVLIQADSLEAFSPFPDAERQRTDDEGRFHFHHLMEEGSSYRLRFWDKNQQGGPPLTADHHFEKPEGFGYHDLGEITLQPAALFAQGQVVDVSGNPIASVHVWPVQENHAPERFVDSISRTRTDKDGKFALYLPPGVDFPNVSAKEVGFQQEVVPAGEELRIVLESTWEAEGKVLFDSSLDSQSISLIVRRTDAPFTTTTLDVTGSSFFRIRDLQGEEYQVEVFSEEYRDVLGTFLFRRASPLQRRHQWGNLDVRNNLRRVTLKFFDMDGAPLEWVGLRYLDPLEDLGMFPGEAELNLKGERQIILVYHSDFLSQVIDTPMQDMEVVLQDGFHATMKFDYNTEGVEDYLMEQKMGIIDAQPFLTQANSASEIRYLMGGYNETSIYGTLPEPGTYRMEIEVRVVFQNEEGDYSDPVRVLMESSANPDMLFEFHEGQDPPPALVITYEDWIDALQRAQSLADG